jgi:transposase InsO family protein
MRENMRLCTTMPGDCTRRWVTPLRTTAKNALAMCPDLIDHYNLYPFETLQEIREITDEWVEIYNYERPHDLLNDMTPNEYL